MTGALFSRRSPLTHPLDWFPGRVAGLIDWHLSPHLRGGIPFNGQFKRAELFRELLKCFEFTAIVETGTFRGLTTAFMRRESNLPVYTVESHKRPFYFADQRFRDDEGIHNSLGDSRVFLRNLRNDSNGPEGSVFFYLDAHLDSDLPLFEELEIIAGGWSDPVIMIDDFQVPDDPGYHFDSYGPGKELVLSNLPRSITSEFGLFWPAVRSDQETGSRRGCVVAGRGDAIHNLSRVSFLRPDAANPEKGQRGGRGRVCTIQD